MLVLVYWALEVVDLLSQTIDKSAVYSIFLFLFFPDFFPPLSLSLPAVYYKI